MCNCNSFWVQQANNILSQLRQRNNLSNNDLAKLHTLEFLLNNNYCGLSNRTSIGSILNYLNSQGINMSRESFQNNVLTDLKRAGALVSLVYPGHEGGIFIPCDIDEVKVAVGQMLDRIEQELMNISGALNNQGASSIYDMVNSIVQYIQQERNQNNI